MPIFPRFFRFHPFLPRVTDSILNSASKNLNRLVAGVLRLLKKKSLQESHAIPNSQIGSSGSPAHFHLTLGSTFRDIQQQGLEIWGGKPDSIIESQIPGPSVSRLEESGRLESGDNMFDTARGSILLSDKSAWQYPSSTKGTISGVRQSERGRHWWDIGLLSIFTGTSSRS